MPRYAPCQLRWSSQQQKYELSIDGLVSEHGLTPGWLDEIASFSFHSRSGEHYTVRKQSAQRGSAYWYGYRRIQGRVVKRYLGRTADLSIARLEEIAYLLVNEAPSDGPTSPEQGITPLPMSSRLNQHTLQASTAARLPLLASRLFPPRLPTSLVDRSRLLTLLDAALEHALTLIQAPAGFGKTTLVNQWIATRCSPSAQSSSSRVVKVAWISLNEGDNDLLRFWRSIIAACQKWHEPVGQTALESLERSMQLSFDAPPPPLETALSFLLNDLALQEQHRLLVLDDYHLITEPHIHESLAFFLEHLSAGVHVLLLSRAEPPLPLLRWRARGTMYELHAADLRFSLEETATFLRQSPGQITPSLLSNTVLEQLDAALEGWAAGLRLLTLMMQGLRTMQEVERYLSSLSQHSHQPLLNYFVTEILDAQPEPLQRFLLQTSVLSRLSGPLCTAITGREDSAGFLTDIERAGLFLEALDGSEAWYRYHSLFAESLRREAAIRLGEETLRSLSLRASHWYEQHAKPEEAIEAALLAADVERAALLIEQIDADDRSWGPQTMVRWLQQMPETVLQAHPALCLDYALSLRFQGAGKEVNRLPTDIRERIETLLQMAEKCWRNQGKMAEVGGLYAFRVLCALGQEPLERVIEYAQQALALLPENNQDQVVQAGLGVSLSFVGIGYLREGRFKKARQCILQAHACSLASGDRHFVLSMVVMLGMLSIALGELHQAAEYYRQALSSAREQEDTITIVQALSGLTWLALEWRDLAAAEQQAREALALLGDTEHELGNQLLFQLALVQHARGQTTSAQQQLAALIARLQTASTPWSLWLLPDVLCRQAYLYLATGDIQAVQHCLETLTHYGDSLDFVQHTRMQILEARLLLVQGQASTALLELERLLTVTQERWMMHDALEIQILLALAYASCQQKQEAHHWLLLALSQARSEGFLHLFLCEGEALVQLLRSLLPTIQEKELHTYAKTILHKSVLPDGYVLMDMSHVQDMLVEPLSPQEQRVLRLVMAGRTNPQIAQELVISVNTVKHHLKQLYRKLAVSNRMEASEAARQLNLF